MKILTIWTTADRPEEWREEIDAEIKRRGLGNIPLTVIVYSNGMRTF